MQHRDRPDTDEQLEAEIRRRARTGAGQLRPPQAANLVNGVEEAEMELSFDEFDALQDAVGALQEAYPDYFRAAQAVAKSEAAADMGRFREWRKEQLALARAADGPAATLAPWLRVGGAALTFAGILALGVNLIGYPALLVWWALSVGLLLLGGRFLKRRTSPLWKGVFSDPKYTCRTVWYAAAQAAAVELIWHYEPGAAVHEEGLRELEENWALRNRSSIRYANEDYTGITALH
ncbi:hypothetical protein H9638_08090 [Arthrobacter sp. Sa2BUA2]|uniref:Uncharacterized protein n=1 Tax=Arthrobacter pullicola TaxID=2762224 RepID=A0ABR8YHT1_9MICC|nr:hypothetical protein [Arthrobacter pullicola]MBD8043773.1 hypothetical protein [Arthrobacter pullicola]